MSPLRKILFPDYEGFIYFSNDKPSRKRYVTGPTQPRLRARKNRSTRTGTRLSAFGNVFSSSLTPCVEHCCVPTASSLSCPYSRSPFFERNLVISHTLQHSSARPSGDGSTQTLHCSPAQCSASLDSVFFPRNSREVYLQTLSTGTRLHCSRLKQR